MLDIDLLIAVPDGFGLGGAEGFLHFLCESIDIHSLRS